MKKIILFIFIFFHSILSAQTDTVNVKLETRLKKIQKENEILDNILRDYNSQIDSLLKIVLNKENENEVTSLLISHYIKMNENIRNKMRLNVYLIDALNTIILKEED